MTYTNHIAHDFADPALQTLFKEYFAFLGVTIRNWQGLFDEISASDDAFILRRDETGVLLGFLIFTTQKMDSSFFSAKIGFVREFYVDPAHREQGHGSALLEEAETLFRREGCGFALLTTETAGDYYEKRGYRLSHGIAAVNHDPVYAKFFK